MVILIELGQLAMRCREFQRDGEIGRTWPYFILVVTRLSPSIRTLYACCGMAYVTDRTKADWTLLCRTHFSHLVHE